MLICVCFKIYILKFQNSFRFSEKFQGQQSSHIPHTQFLPLLESYIVVCCICHVERLLTEVCTSFRFPQFLPSGLFLFQDPIQDPRLHLLNVPPQAITVSQTFFVFDNLDSFVENLLVPGDSDACFSCSHEVASEDRTP